MSDAGGSNNVRVRFLAGHEQRTEDVAHWLAAFISQTQQTLDIAAYDFRLSAVPRQILAAALAERAAAGVAIRIAYDGDKPEPPDLNRGMDPAPPGTGAFVQSLGYPWRRIGGMKLMHHKYLLRDAGRPEASVWTGSTNHTDDSWTLQENNILELDSPQLASYYAEDFEQLWSAGNFESSGGFDTNWANLVFQGTPVEAHVLFSPGRGEAIDHAVAERVAGARRRVRICSMLLNSSALLNALTRVLGEGQVLVSGLYDETQMEDVLRQWQDVPQNHWKIDAIREVVATAGLIGKHSTPYSPDTPHDFMHNKVLVVDDTVITGSYNFSHSAEQNAENILFLENAALADLYAAYIDHVMDKYREIPDR